MLTNIINSIFAGIMIAIGSATYINCPNKIVGAFLFSIGLITIMAFNYNLYTGKIGYVRTKKQLLEVLVTFLFNLIGCIFILGMVANNSSSIMENKINQELWKVFCKSIACGILIYVCVDQKKKQDIITTLIAVPAFILCGAEHSIADFCFIVAEKAFSIRTTIFLLVVTLGNALGSLAFGIWRDIQNNELCKNK